MSEELKTSTAELLPCPFCGNDGKLHIDSPNGNDEWDYVTAYVACECCDACGPNWASAKEAIDEWNTRADVVSGNAERTKTL